MIPYVLILSDSVPCQVVAEFGKVNHLVNSVAYFGSQSLEATEEDWDRTMR